MKSKTYSILVWLLVACTISCSAQENPSTQSLPKTYTSDPTEVMDRLDYLFSQEANYQHLSGVVLIRSADSLVYTKSFGGIERGVTDRLTTRFDIGSITKQFTAAAILHLVKEGRLNLHDPINKHLGMYATDKWKKVTIHHLLTHTSGIPSIYQTEQGLDLFFPEEEPILLTDLLAKFREGKLLFKPGEEFGYSNSGYALLAVIIEQASGMPYEQFMIEHLFKAYGLTNTGLQTTSGDAVPYYGYRNDLSSQAPRYDYSWSLGSGGIYATAIDLSRWLSIIRSDTFLTTELRTEYLSSHTNVGYGYGWQITRDGKAQHDGGTAGFTSFVSLDTSSGHQVIILTNRGFEDIHSYGKSAEYIQNLVTSSWDILEGKTVDSLPKIKVNGSIDQHYTLQDGSQISLKSENDTTVWVSAEGTAITRLIANTPLDGQSEKEKMMLDLAQLLLKKKHWAAAKYMDGEMKFVSYSGLLGMGMRMMRKKTGKLQSIIPYFVDEDYGLMRMTGEDSILDIIAYFDEGGKVQGLFEHGSYSLDEQIPMLAYPIGNDQFYVDGLNYGEKNALLEIKGNELIIKQLERSLRAQTK